ncbi:ribbon-helix-helix domain-containing protein [Methanobrevibacter sp.]|uniref:ribbon-helix-helix domain-containing protein n=1 Tax=Methanobrevibacter sp. TaxID=66852 RepID=UPI003867D904
MCNDRNENVKSQVNNSNTLDYKIQPVSVKLTEKIEKQLDYIADQTQMSRSNIIRYSITELYRKMKMEAGDD